MKNRKNIFIYILILIIIIMGIYIFNLSKNYDEDKKISSGELNSLTSTNNLAENINNNEDSIYLVEEKEVKVYNVSLILENNKKIAEEIILRLDEGEKFEDLMNEYDGVVSNFYAGDMTIEGLGEAIAKLEFNEYTKEPVKTEFGYYVILRNDKEDMYARVKVYNASHILVDDRKTAEEIILRLDKGEKFEELMNEYYGENLGNFYEGVMVEEFEEAVASLNVNEYTKEPVKSEYGYHIILRNKTN